jgi:translation initiation factor IF-3
VNNRIRFPQVRVIGSDGSQLGVMPTRDALRLAREEGLDLVEISPKARPPVCRILDFGRYQYEEAKNAKKAKKRQQATQLKEMRFRPKIDEHDINFKTNRLREFLQEGHKVRAYVEFRGREMTHTEFGHKILARIREQLEDVGQPEPSVRMEGRHMSLIINPLKGAGKKKQEDSKPDSKKKQPGELPESGNAQPEATTKAESQQADNQKDSEASRTAESSEVSSR